MWCGGVVVGSGPRSRWSGGLGVLDGRRGPHPALRATFPKGEGLGRGLRAARGLISRLRATASPHGGSLGGGLDGRRGNLIRRLRRHLPLSKGKAFGGVKTPTYIFVRLQIELDAADATD